MLDTPTIERHNDQAGTALAALVNHDEASLAPDIGERETEAGRRAEIAPRPETQPAEFTEAQARAYLAECVNRPSIRACAAAWHWPKSRAERFIAKVDAETKRETVAAVSAPSHSPHVAKLIRTMKDAGASSEQIGIAVDAVVKREADEDEAESKVYDPFTTSDNPDRLFCDQPETATYWNAGNQIVIIQATEIYGTDPYVRIDRDKVPALIARLQAMLRGGD